MWRASSAAPGVVQSVFRFELRVGVVINANSAASQPIQF
jgi:hypothetical protein